MSDQTPDEPATDELDERPDGVDEADYVEQHQLADSTRDGSSPVPQPDLDVEADEADLQEQATPVPVDEDDDR